MFWFLNVKIQVFFFYFGIYYRRGLYIFDSLLSVYFCLDFYFFDSLSFFVITISRTQALTFAPASLANCLIKICNKQGGVETGILRGFFSFVDHYAIFVVGWRSWCRLPLYTIRPSAYQLWKYLCFGTTAQNNSASTCSASWSGA